MIPEDIKQDILRQAQIFDVLDEYCSLKKTGKSFYTECPNCGKKGKAKGLIVTPSKNIAKCFSCDYSPSAVNYLMEKQQMNFPEALEYLAKKYNINIHQEPKKKGPQKKTKKEQKTYCQKQLEESGLTPEDIKALVVIDDKTKKEMPVFEAGTRDQYGRIQPGDDVIIWYYDLEGKPVTFKKNGSQKEYELFRVRWQNPDLHLDKSGNPIKYQSPKDSGSHIYIPEKIRRIYQEGRQIKRLFIQEGEKKAEKACKHGIPSVGIMGINNIGSRGNLPAELQLIVKQCGVEEVIFILDSDWDHLSSKLGPGDKVDKRPWSFYNAIKSFKDYFRTFENLGVYLELYFGHIKENEKKDKGIDDLLTNTLKDKERELLEDINFAVNDKKGSGSFVQIHKITTQTDAKIMELWNLNSVENFVKKYKEELIGLPEFRIGKHPWRFNENEELELAQPLQDDEQFWEKYEVKQGLEGFRFRYLYAYNFLRRRGYGRIHVANGHYNFAHIENRIVKLVEPYQIKDFALELAKEILPEKEKVDVMDMLYRGGKMYFGPDSLGNIDFVNPVFENSGRDFQYLFFSKKYWRISADKIDERPITELQNHVWNDKINHFDATLNKDPLVQVTEITQEIVDSLPAEKKRIWKDFIGQYSVDISEDGQKCHFLKYVVNTGEFFWDKFVQYDVHNRRHLIEDTRTTEERMETNLHLVNKMTAFGYLLHQYFDPSEPKAVIGMDGKNSEVGSSNGGSGKSLFGDAIGHVVPQVSIPGKSKNPEDDNFYFEEVDERTANVFIDDVRAGFDFEFLFPYITGKFSVNKKGVGKFTLPKERTPKFYIPTNHALNGEGSSFRRRQFLIAFSDYYNDKHSPLDDFGVRFFDEWDSYQWNLFYNFCACCLQLYFEHGLIEGPTERLELRRLRQQIGEEFLNWADEYFSYDEPTKKFQWPGNDNTNRPIPRKELNDDFTDKNPTQKRFVTAAKFKKKFRYYCQYREAVFNPHKFFDKEENFAGADDKSGGIEYFTLADENYTR